MNRKRDYDQQQPINKKHFYLGIAVYILIALIFYEVYAALKIN